MADFDVAGSFGADVSRFNAGMQSAGAAAQGLATQARAAAAQVTGSFAGINLSTFKPFDPLIAGMTQAGAGAAQLGNQLAATGAAAMTHGAGIGFYAREVHAMMDELMSGRTAQLQGTFTNVASTFLQANLALLPFAAGLAVVGGSLAYVVVRAIEAKAALDQVRVAFALGGVGDPGSEAINKLIESLERLSGVSYDDAAKTVAAFGNMRNASLPLVEALTNGVVEFARATGTEMPDAAVALRKAFEDPAAGVRTLQGLIGGITGEQIAYVEATQRSGSTSAAQGALLRVFAEAMAGATRELRNRTEAMRLDVEQSARFAAVQGESAGLTDLFSSRLQEQTRRLDERSAALRRGADAVSAMPTPRLDISAGADVTRAINPLTTQLEKAEGDVRKLEASIKALQDELGSGPLTDESRMRVFAQLGEQGRALLEATSNVRRLNDEIGNTESFDRRRAAVRNTSLEERRDAIETTQIEIQLDLANLGIFRGNAEQRTALETQLAQHRATLRRQQSELEVAASGVELTSAQRVTSAVLDAQLKGIAARRTAAGQDRAENLRLDAEEIAARQRSQEDQNTITRTAAEQRMQIATNEVKAREAGLREQATQGQIFVTTEIAGLMAASREREAIERGYLTTVRGTYANNTVEYTRYQGELTALDARYAAERANIERQASQQTFQFFNSSFQQIGSSFSTQIMGMIRGTTSFRAAIGNVALDIVGQFVSGIAKMVASWAAGQATMLVASITGSTARASAETAGSGISIAAVLANAWAHIQSGVAATIAGVAGNQALIVGPAAPAEGAAAGAAVEAAATAALALDTGTWNVPVDMLANIHKGEMVVPRFEAEELRKGATAASGDNHFHFPGIMDAGAFMSMLRSNSGPLARIISKAMTDNRSLRPGF
jgi:hypothetical protein